MVKQNTIGQGRKPGSRSGKKKNPASKRKKGFGKKIKPALKWFFKSPKGTKYYFKTGALFFSTLALTLLCNVPLVYYFNRVLANTPIIKFTEYRLVVLIVDILFAGTVIFLNYRFIFPLIIKNINDLLPKKGKITYVFSLFVFLLFLYLYQEWNLGYIIRSHEAKISGLVFTKNLPGATEHYAVADYSGLSFNEVSPGLLNETDISSTYGRCLRTYRWDQYIKRIEKQYAIEPNLLAGLIMQESYGNPLQLNSRNDGGAGLMMFQPGTARQYGLKVYGSSTKTGRDEAHGLQLLKLLQEQNFSYRQVAAVDERFHVVKSMDAGARFLKDLYAIHHSWDKALSAYNRGKPAVLPQTTQHVRQVRFFQGQYEKFLREQ